MADETMTTHASAALSRRLVGLALCLTNAAACVGGPRPAAPVGTAAGAPLSVMTFNLRYAHTQPPDLWPDRLPVISDLVERRRPDIIGTQEGLYHQIRDLETSMPAYAWIGTGRDGGSRGEFMAVFYRRDRFEPIQYDNYWLSDTPKIAGSRSWGNNYPRMVTSVRFRDRVHGGELLFVNTHLDHESQRSRELSAALIMERLATTPDGIPVILVGDFNAGAGDNPVYSLLTGPGGFTDSWVAAGNPDTLGTFHGFKGVAAALDARRIDWILLRGPAAVLSSEIITDARGDQLPSDHFPVLARVRLTAPAPVPLATPRTVAAWVTTGDQSRLLEREPDLRFTGATIDVNIPVIDVDYSQEFQSVVGWGAAMSDAAAYLIHTKLGARQREALLQELFGREPGIGFSFVRIPMGASDFSRSHYSYDDRPAGEADSTLAHFSIDVDRAEKIPTLKRALAINPQLKLVGSPWSPPAWMKSSGSLIKGTLLPRFHGSFAEYFRRWIEAYEAEGLPIFAITLQNEPHFEPENYPGMRLSPAQRAAIIGGHVGPLFARHGIHAQIWDWDHNWDEPGSPLAVLADPVARPYVAAVAWHCYGGDVSAQTVVHDRHPDKDTYFTECSGGEWAPVWADNLKWNVSTMVIGNARAWAKGVALWNLALDENHGPHLGGCGDCRGVVTIHSATGEITRNSEYYALAHASRFVRPGAVRIGSSAPNGLETVAFRNADDRSTALIVLNSTTLASHLAVRVGEMSFTTSLPAGAVATFTWK